MRVLVDPLCHSWMELSLVLSAQLHSILGTNEFGRCAVYRSSRDGWVGSALMLILADGVML